MKKRMISLLLCLCMVFSLLPTVVLADGESVESNQTFGDVCQDVTWEYDTESKTLTVRGSGLITLNDKSGNTHPWDAFKAEIEHLVIDDGITGTDSIKVFANLSALRTVQFPSTLKTLATGTFATDTALSSVVLPKTIESIGNVVFSMCTGLTSLTIRNRKMTAPVEGCWSSDDRPAPDGLTVYGYKWKSDDNKEDNNQTDFYRYVQWQNKNNGGSIQFVAFDDAENAKGGLIKNAAGSSNQIYWAFNDATKTLTVSGTGDINWDGSPECYNGGENPPWNDYKSQIENLVIGEGITGTSKIKIFAGLANLKSIQFPSTFKRLYSGAFASCSKLESVTLPEQLVSMGDVVFSNCTNLKTLVVKNQNLTTPTKGHWSTNLTGDSNNPVYKLPADLTVYGYKWKSDNKVDENLTGIYQYVQWQNENNTNGTIQFVAFDDDDAPASSGLIVGSDDIFWSFDSNTKTLTVSGEGNITWDAKLYKAGDNPPWATFIPQIEKLVIGEGITGSSETKLFANLTCLKQISFPSTFTSMGDGTFATASALENVVIPATVTKMGPVVFSACDNLKTLTVLNRTMRIINAESDWTTAGRPAPQNLTVYGYKWKSDDKKSDENLTDIYKYVQYNNAQGGKITFVAQDESDWMPIDATGISWRYDAATKTLYLMGSGEIKLVGDQYKGGDNPPWSAHLSQVENLVIGEGITGTGTLKIFSSLTKLQNVSFPSTFKKLDTGTFATCSSLERIVLPETISSMGSVVFSRCNAMTSLVVKNRNLSVPVETEWSSDKTIPQNLTVYGYRYTDDTRKTETKLYQYVQWQNKNYSGTINFVAFDDPNATAGQIGNSDTYWRYDPETTTLFITGKGMIPGGSSGNYPWQAYADEITNLVIGDGVTGTEATKALAELYKLRSITFGKDFAILGAAAFANIQTLTQLTLPETITTFGSFPFSGCYGMTELRVECRNIQVANVNSYWNGSETQPLPKNLTVYGYRYTAKGGTEETAFYKYITNVKNNGIKFVDLDAEADLLGDIRWNYDSSAKKLTISGKGEVPAVSGGTAWSRYANEIEEIEIEKGVTSIEADAFTGMPMLKTVTINRTVTNIAADAFDTSSSNLTIKAKRNSAAKTFAKANNINFEEIVTANILFIGNSYTEDAREYLSYVFNQYDFPVDIHFGHLFSGGKTLAYYANTARQETGNSSTYGEGAYDNDSPRAWESGEGGNTYTNSLTYYTWDNNQTTFASQGTKSIAYAMNDQDWDIVIIQGHDIEQAYGDKYNKYNKNFATNLEYLTNYIKSFDSTVEIGWYMTWRRNGGEGLARLQAYWETMQQTVATNKNVSFIVPIGTAVENARGTYINQFNYRPESQSNIAKVNLLTGQSIGSTMTPDNNNGIQRDETHMSAVVGRFLAGYTMGEMLVNHINGLGGAKFTNKRPIEQIYSYDTNIGLLPAEYVQTIKACAEAAMAYPYAVTPLTDHAIDPVETVKTLVESVDFTNTEWNGTAIQDKVAGDLLAQKPGAKVTGVSITGNTATVTLRYGYSTINALCQRNIEPPTEDDFANGLVTVKCLNPVAHNDVQYGLNAAVAAKKYAKNQLSATEYSVTYDADAFAVNGHSLYSADTLNWKLTYDGSKWKLEPRTPGVDDVVLVTHAPTTFDEVTKFIDGSTDVIHTSCLNGETATCAYGLMVAFVNPDHVVSVEQEKDSSGEPIRGSYIATLKMDQFAEACAKACNSKSFASSPRTHDVLSQNPVQWRFQVRQAEVSTDAGTEKQYVWSAEPVEAGKDDVCQVAHNWVVTFNPDNGEPAFTQDVKYEGKATEPETAPKKKGYTFDGWYLDEAEAPFDFDTTTITSDITLTAKWEAKKANVHLVIFKSGDLSTPIVDVPYAADKLAGETIDLTEIDPSSYLDFDFEIDGGWYDDGLFNLYTNYVNGEQGNKPAALTELQINGNWQNLKLIVTEMVPVVYFDSLESLTAYQNDHSKTEGILHTTKARVGSDLPTVDAPIATREGYTFTFWSREGQTVDVTGQTVNGWTNLYANWKANSYTATFDANGGETANPESKEVTFDAAYGPLAATSRKSYTLVGWFTAKDGGAKVESTTVVATAGDHTLYAHWTPNTYNYEIHYYVQQPDGSYVEDASALDTTKSGTFDSTVTVTPDANKYGAHYSYNSVKSVVSGVVSVDDPATILKLNVYYDLDFHTLTFDTMGGSRIDPVTVRHGNAVAKPKDPVNGGYIFDGWYTDKTYRTPYNFATVLTQDTTIYAKWFLIALPGVTVKKTPPKLNTADHFAYVQGYPDGTVKPTGNITRAETAAILFRLMDEGSRKTYYSTKSGFRDVATGSWYNTYVATLNNAGVITDSSNGYFRPNEAITRAELAAMLANFTETAGAANYFNDVSASYWAANAIAICAKLGWITGYPDGTFRPDQTVTRAEMMAMINRALERTPKSAADLLAGMKVWSDNANVNAWYYLDVQEATNSHTYTKSGTHETWKKLR